MQRFVPATAVLLLLAGTAQAADFARRPAYAAIPYSWAGPYLGGNIGYGWATATTGVSIGGAGFSASERLDGVIGGVQLGYNWQTGAIVFGLEGDFQASGQEHFSTLSSGGVTISENDKIPWFATFRGRLGFALDQWLFYGTGGLAVSQIKSTGTVTSGGVTSMVSGSAPQAAWTLGAGIETALWGSNWTAKIEYLYINSLDVQTTTLGITTSNSAVNNIVRLGVNYRF